MPGTKLYTRNTWVDEVLAGAELYNVLTSGGGPLLSSVQIVLATGVSTPGTLMSAARMNNLEAGVDAIDDLLNNYINPTHTTAGTSTAYTVDTLKDLALTTGELFRVKWHATAGASPTLSRDGLTAKPLKYFNSSGTKTTCTSAQIVSGMLSRVYYDGVDYIVLDTPQPAGLPVTSALSDFVVGDGAGNWVKKTLAETRTILSISDAMVFRGVIDCSTNPNYPAADAGDTYKVSVAGKIGGASGLNVEAGDLLTCTVDGTASGTQAGVGANWVVTQTNIDGAVTGQASSIDNELVLWSGTSGKVIKRSSSTGLVKVASGVVSVVTAPSGAVVGDTDAQTLQNKTLGAGTVVGAAIDGALNTLHGFKGNINAQTGTTYTTVDGDNGKVITLNNASPVTVTIHQEAPAGFNCLLVQKGAGQVTVAAGGTGAIRNRSSHMKIAGQYGEVSVLVESNAGTAPQVYVVGDTAA